MNRFFRLFVAALITSTVWLMAAAVRVSAQSPVAPVFSWLKAGEVMPAGWLKAQMERDLREGFAGRLDQLAPEARSDIFGSGRNAPGKPNNPGAPVKDSQWWNGETEGNWRSAYIMMAYMSQDAEAKRQADAYVAHILETQDTDGYIGVYSPELRYSQTRWNGELWTQTCISRGLLAYYETTGRTDVLKAVERLVQLTMSKYGPGKMSVFGAPGTDIGIGHDLMFVDVLERLYTLTGDAAYRDFGLWLYQDFNASDTKHQFDTTLASLLDLPKPLVYHGPTTLEQFRVPLWAYAVTGNPDFKLASDSEFNKARQYVLPGGAVIAMEEIGGRIPDPTQTYYEYCAMKEQLMSSSSDLQKRGEGEIGDAIERLAFNAAEGARTAGGKEITYCTRDNRYRIDGEVGNRSKFSPAHSDVAVCCNPNATYFFPVFVRAMWMRTQEDGLAATLYGPSSVKTKVKGVEVQIDESTNYPFSPTISINVSPERPLDFALLLRNPGWSAGTRVTCAGAVARRDGDYFVVRKEWKKGDRMALEFTEPITASRAANGEFYLERGPLVYALRIPEVEKVVKSYSVAGFSDLNFLPAQGAHWAYAFEAGLGKPGAGFAVKNEKDANMLYPYDRAPVRLEGKLTNLDTAQKEDVSLVPMGSGLAILRRLTFPVATATESQRQSLISKAKAVEK